MTSVGSRPANSFSACSDICLHASPDFDNLSHSPFASNDNPAVATAAPPVMRTPASSTASRGDDNVPTTWR